MLPGFIVRADLGTVTAPDGFIPETIGLGGIMTWILNVVFLIAAILALVYLIWGAISWITSGGDKGKTAEARGRIIAAVVGLILLAATWTILQIVLSLLNAGSLQQLMDNVPNTISG